ncbi:MAG: DNA alkylation repair protein [Planctomycetota bacterium]
MASKLSVLQLLKEHADPRGISHWETRPRSLKSYGIGLTQLRKLAKQVGRDHQLAASLWDSDLYDAKVISILIDDPKCMTAEQAERQVDDGMDECHLVHVFTSCNAPLAKTPFAFYLASTWVDHSDAIRRRCGYSLLYELSKKNPKGMDDAFLRDRISIIQSSIHGEDMWVRESMLTALLGIGKRNQMLNAACIAAAKKIGAVDIDYGDDNSCQPLDLLKHLTAPALQQKLNSQ